jgi:hypothetical protein
MGRGLRRSGVWAVKVAYMETKTAHARQGSAARGPPLGRAAPLSPYR